MAETESVRAESRWAGGGEVLAVISVDTEEDNWTPSRDSVTVDNIRHIPEFHSTLRELGVRPTYFVTHAVSSDPWAARLLSETVADGSGELAAHLHSWNTPPIEEPLTGRNTVLQNLPPELQRRKLERLTDQHVRVFGRAPTSFRAGRFGVGMAAIAALIDLGYRADSSVTPFWSWENYDDGPDYHGASNGPYRVSREAIDVRGSDPAGKLVELPISVGFTRRPFGLWSAVHRTLTATPLKRLRLAGVAARTGLFQKVILTPENETVADMVALSSRLIAGGTRYLNLFLHSSSLEPGLTPSTPAADDVRRLKAATLEYVQEIQRLAPIRFVTATEAADAWTARSESSDGRTPRP